jgi:CubicO group peptidase (beta-lactamase class C family)
MHTSHDAAAISDLALRFMEAFDIPGLAVAVVSPQGWTLARGHGVRKAGEPAAVGANTVFAIGSTSKAFLSACLAILVDEGRITWDDPVVRHLPKFAMSDPVVTQMMTIRDLLVHRSGLPPGAGDLMQFPPTDHTPADVLKALRHFNLSRGFRTGYAYDNALYLVAGMLLERVSGADWNRFVTERILTPLAMSDAASHPSLIRTADRAARHARLGPPTIGMGPLEAIEALESPLIGPAGGISASAADLVPWMQVQLARGRTNDGARLWSESRADEMWTPHTIVSSGPGPSAEAPQRSVMQGYALGWGVSDYRSRRMLSHGGSLAGQSSRITLLPEQGIGSAILSNSGDTETVSGLRYALLDHLLGVSGFDWLGATQTGIERIHAQVHALGNLDASPPAGTPTLALEAYAGRYRDPWYGDLLLEMKDGVLHADFTRTPAFKSVLEPFGPDAFRTRFARGAGEDAVLSFRIADGRVSALTLRALSPIADFSFDFHDLAFAPVRE